MVAATRARAEAAAVPNIIVEQRDFIQDGSGPSDAAHDCVMLFNILPAEEPHVLLDEARRVVSAGGILGVMHWNCDPSTPRGPSMEIWSRPEQILCWAGEAGFQVVAPGDVDLPPHLYGFAFRLGQCGSEGDWANVPGVFVERLGSEGG